MKSGNLRGSFVGQKLNKAERRGHSLGWQHAAVSATERAARHHLDASARDTAPWLYMRIHTPAATRDASRTYVFPVELTPEADGRWSATCPMLPGCATWGGTREIALRNIQEAAEAYVEDMVSAGEALPESIRPLDHIAVSVTV
ncbi:MAG: type II toxin-antitoxin system HicB family antitoxin [Polyangiaceae bacterium]|nr:type II toxin-antitoxin system HicB family antitoxin [Polyangiaceae bacterium]